MVAMQSRAPKEKKHNQQVNYTTMKKLLFGLWCAAFAIGCTTDPYQADVPAVEGAPRIEISGKISQNYATRVDDGGFCQGDQVGLFGVNYTDRINQSLDFVRNPKFHIPDSIFKYTQVTFLF